MIKKQETDKSSLSISDEEEAGGVYLPNYEFETISSGYITQFPCFIKAYAPGKVVPGWGYFQLFANGVIVDMSVNDDPGGRPGFTNGYFGPGVKVTNSLGTDMSMCPLKKYKI